MVYSVTKYSICLKYFFLIAHHLYIVLRIIFSSNFYYAFTAVDTSNDIWKADDKFVYNFTSVTRLKEFSALFDAEKQE